MFLKRRQFVCSNEVHAEAIDEEHRHEAVDADLRSIRSQAAWPSSKGQKSKCSFVSYIDVGFSTRRKPFINCARDVARALKRNFGERGAREREREREKTNRRPRTNLNSARLPNLSLMSTLSHRFIANPTFNIIQHAACEAT